MEFFLLFFFLSWETSYSGIFTYRLNKHKPLAPNCSLEKKVRDYIYCENNKILLNYLHLYIKYIYTLIYICLLQLWISYGVLLCRQKFWTFPIWTDYHLVAQVMQKRTNFTASHSLHCSSLTSVHVHDLRRHVLFSSKIGHLKPAIKTSVSLKMSQKLIYGEIQSTATTKMEKS